MSIRPISDRYEAFDTESVLALERLHRPQALVSRSESLVADAPAPMRRAQSAVGLADTTQLQTDTGAVTVTTADLDTGTSLAGLLDLSATDSNGGAQALLADSASAATGIVQAAVAQLEPTASAEELGIVDLMLADPLNVALIAAYSPQVPALHTGISGVFIERYGEERAGRMAQLAEATQSVRNLFTAAVQREFNNPQADCPWWRTWVENGGRYQRSERHWDFDMAKFSKWYCEQPGLEKRAFAALYGDSVSAPSVQHSRGSERSVESYTIGANQFRVSISHEPITGSRQQYGWTDRVSSSFGRIVAFDPNDPPRLHDVQAVGFDPTLGFVTHGDNLVVDDDTEAFALVVGVMVGFATAGTASGIVASVTEASGSAALGAAAGGAFSGLVTSFATGVVTGNLNFKSLLVGALTGAAAAGITQAANLNTAGLDAAGNIVDYGARILAVTGKATLQGALADLAGGRFIEGFTSGIASGFAGEVTRGLNQQIAAALKSHQITDGQASVLRTLAQATGSAISSLANPDDAGYAVARDFLNSMLTSSVEAGPGNAGTGDTSSSDGGGNGAEATEGAQSAGESATGAAGGATQRVVITGRNLPRDSLGNGLEIDAQGNAFVHLAEGGGTIVLGSLSPDLVAELAGPGLYAGSFLSRLATSDGIAVGDVLRLGMRLPSLAAIGAAVIEALPALTASQIGMVIVGMALPGNMINDGTQTVSMGENQRFVIRPGDLYGRVQERSSNGDWEFRHEARAYDIGGQFAILTDEQIARLRDPMINVPVNPAPDGTPGYVPIDVGTSTPGYQIPDIDASGREEYPAEEMRLDDLIVESRGIGPPGSPEHKAASWDLYKARGGEWGYGRWLSVYETNQTRASDASAAADAYHASLGWGVREVTIADIAVGGETTSRRLDIADAAERKGIEYKTGYQSQTADNLWELQRDAELVSRGWQIEWVFRDSASKPLLDALDKAGIKYRIGE